MTIGASIRARLLADVSTAALIGTRMYAVRAPQSTDPNTAFTDRIVYKMTGWDREKILSGSPVDLNSTEWELHCQSEDYDRAHSLASAVVASLDQFTGVMGGGVHVGSCVFTDGVDDDETLLGVFSVVLRFRISYKS